MILLDTHVLIWAAEDVAQLGSAARQQINDAAQAGGLWISAITPWEISMLAAKRRVRLSQDVRAWMRAVLSKGARVAPLEPEIAVSAGQLPEHIHGDPADRVIIATAVAMECPVLTVDRLILGYAEAGFVQAVDARL